jgi:MFS transporter, NNP family, nitrate/nitrite transporter
MAPATGRPLVPAADTGIREKIMISDPTPRVTGSPRTGLTGATLGFFVGFGAVALFGPTAMRFREAMDLSPMALGFLVAMPALSGSLLRIPFSAWVDTTGGRKPFLVLLMLSALGMAGVWFVVATRYPDNLTPSLYPLLLVLGLFCGCGIATFSVGISQVSYWFPQQRQGTALAVYAGVGNLAPGVFSLLMPFAIGSLGLAGAYLAWLAFLVTGTIVYALIGRNAWYFQLRAGGVSADAAKHQARAYGQELFPAGTTIQTLKTSARVWQTWALVAVYFTTFGGFVALTAWLPTYWGSAFGVTVLTAGVLTAMYSLLASTVRIAGGVMADNLREGGYNTSILAMLIMLAGALLMTTARDFELAIPGILLLAIGMGVCNAAVFKIVPQVVPHAIGGAAGWIGGIGALGGFVIPPAMAFAVRDLGPRGYSIGFVVFVFLALMSLGVAWVLKYAPAAVEPRKTAAVAPKPAALSR